MAPARNKKTRTSIDSDISTRQQLPAATPHQSPRKRIMSITEAQKQALIDNLQLEVTERARKLRAQYALQAQSLRTRIELRINRIPAALRKANMGELIAKHEEMQQGRQKANVTDDGRPAVPEPAVLACETVEEVKTANTMAASKPRGTKRNSDYLETGGKDSITIHEDPIPNPKKRTKVANDAASRRPPNPSTVLSPKSANSRTLPQSPIRPTLGSPQKSFNSRPASPLKPRVPPVKADTVAATASFASMAMVKPKPGRPKGAGGKPATAKSKREQESVTESEGLRTVSSTSSSSAMSTGTMIVKNTKKPPLASTKKVVGVKAVGKKVATAPEVPQVGRRVLRKRA